MCEIPKYKMGRSEVTLKHKCDIKKLPSLFKPLKEKKKTLNLDLSEPKGQLARKIGARTSRVLENFWFLL